MNKIHCCITLLLLMFNACGSDGGGTAGTSIDQLIIGSVVREDGSAIEAVAVQIDEVGTSALSDSSGHFVISAEVPEQFTLSFFKPEVVDDSLNFNSNENIPLQGDFIVSDDTGEVNFVEKQPENVPTEQSSTMDTEREPTPELPETEETPITPTGDSNSPFEVDSGPIGNDSETNTRTLSLRGIVINQSGMEPLSGVKIKITPPSSAVTTAENGEFSLSDVVLQGNEQKISFFASFTLNDGTSIIIDTSVIVIPNSKFLGIVFRCSAGSALCKPSLVTGSESAWSSNISEEQTPDSSSEVSDEQSADSNQTETDPLQAPLPFAEEEEVPL